MNFLKIVGVIFILIILASFLPLSGIVPSANSHKFGVSFSPGYARYLGLDWQQTFIRMLDELRIKALRLPTYWNNLEKMEGQFDFSEVDFMLSSAQKTGAKVILVVGARQPRFPECHYPSWAKGLTVQQRQQKTLEFVQKVVERYQNNPAIVAWQVENEPFVTWFGEGCDPPDLEFLQKEVKLVKQLDSKKQIILTDSGEWGSWIDAIKFSDIVGISLYRRVYNNTLGMYISYPFAPWMYQLKSTVIRKVFAPQNQKTIIAELQAEAWLSDKDMEQDTAAIANKFFSLADFKENINFAQKTGFDEAYLWGVEWWYFMEKQGYPQYLDYAKILFR